jgi:hypothetical protein
MGSVQTTQYIRKPLYVAAVRITGANFEEVANWCQGEIQQDDPPDEKGPGKKFIRVRVHNPKNPRQTKAYVGDWLLYTERGYKVYTNKAFHDSFDEVASGGAPNGHGAVIMGSEEIMTGVTLDEAIAMLRDGRLQFIPVIQREEIEEETQENTV